MHEFLIQSITAITTTAAAAATTTTTTTTTTTLPYFDKTPLTVLARKFFIL